jgi:hypothetical protein
MAQSLNLPKTSGLRFEACIAVKTYIVILWVMATHSLVARYQHTTNYNAYNPPPQKKKKTEEWSFTVNSAEGLYVSVYSSFFLSIQVMINL